MYNNKKYKYDEDSYDFYRPRHKEEDDYEESWTEFLFIVGVIMAVLFFLIWSML